MTALAFVAGAMLGGCIGVGWMCILIAGKGGGDGDD